MASQSDIFTRRVRDFMMREPSCVPVTATCGETLARLSAGTRSSVLVLESGNRIAGIVTEYDAARRMAFKVDPATPVSEIMSRPVETIGADDLVYQAVGRMRRSGLRHLPVVDPGGAAVGMLSLDDAMAVVSQDVVARIDLLTNGEGADWLKRMRAAQPEIAEALLADGVAAHEILVLNSQINNDVHRRLTDAIIEDLRTAGMGAPPVPFAVIVMGSGGRGESYLQPDQDNGLVLADYAPGDHDDINRYFIALSERLTRDLAAVGIPLCKGAVMATNPVWRKSLDQWKRQLAYWMRRRGAASILLGDVFFDFVPVWGATSLADDLRAHVTATLPNAHPYLQAMEAAVSEYGTSLGLFGRIRTERRGAFKGRVNLKHAGTLPLVNSLRLMALRHGIPEAGTLARAAALAELGILGPDVHDELVAAFTLVTDILLRQQLADWRSVGTVSNFVDPQRLRRRERARLVEALRTVEALRARVHSDFTGEIF